MRFNRECSERLLNLAKFFPCVVLTGARQTGKTTLLKHLFPKYSYVSLDLPSVADQVSSDPISFMRSHPAPIIIDEVQYAPQVFRYLKIEIDKDRELRGQFILTGSQKFTLMKSVADSLAGRVGVMELEGLSSFELGNEIRDYITKNGAANTIARGFFPQLWSEPDFPSFEFYQSYIATYLERDVREILNVNSLRDFERFMRACAIRSGNLLNKSELAKDVGIHHKTANDWLSVLQASNQIILLEPFFNNETKRIVKSPKLYFSDTGLLCALLGLREGGVDHYVNIGHIWETYLFSAFRKKNTNLGLNTKIWFYRNQQGLEVDFVLEKQGQLELIESKWAQRPDKKSVFPMEQLENKLSNVISKNIYCRTEHPYTLGDTKVLNGFFIGP